jgi:nucleotide-binding universal stress UspA family protein
MGQDQQRSPVIVGVDGSGHTRGAVEWAAREAVLRDVPVRVVHAYVWPLLRIPPVVSAMGPPEGLREHASELVAESVARALSAAPGVDVQSSMCTDFPEDLLVKESRNAAYVVIGSRGLGTVGRLLVGSVTARLIVRSECPVALVRTQLPATDAGAPVVVGVDGSSHSATALAVAVDLATHWESELHVVHVARAPSRGQPIDIDVEGMVAPWRETCPDLRLRVSLLEGRRPDKALVELSQAARGVVVGARGSSGFAGILIGSVSQAVISRAHCPVVVTPARMSDPPPGQS